MDKLSKQILNKRIENNPIWLMRQAGRYLPEFREIRKNNPNFIKLCLNEELSTEITLQPIKRFNFDAAIIFSDILMVPYGLGQVVEFKKNFGPILGDLNLENILEKNEEDFIKNINPVYKAINKVSTHQSLKDKDTIGFVGAPWTILMYMFNKQSPKKKLPVDLLNKTDEIKKVLEILDKFLKIHIENQVKNGATIIQIFDSWAGLLEEKYINDYIYNPTYSLVKYTQSLNVPVICFPRNIKSYKEFVNVVKPDAINIDYEVDPKKIKEQIDIPIQGGLDPKILLTDNQNIKKNALLYLDIFREHPYIFNLGHGVLPETDPSSVEYLVKVVKDF
tara:strand:+ start:11724 stop:12725 length:1002 start_codon:yes stop_codon:yes gene_type:complete